MKARILKKPPFHCALVRPFSAVLGYTKELYPQVVTQHHFLSHNAIEPILCIEAKTARDAWKLFLRNNRVKAEILKLEKQGYLFSDTMHN